MRRRRCNRVRLAKLSSGWKRLTVTRGVSSPGRRSTRPSSVRKPLPWRRARDRPKARRRRKSLHIDRTDRKWSPSDNAGPWPRCASASSIKPAMVADERLSARECPIIRRSCAPCARQADGAGHRPGAPRNRSRMPRAPRPSARPVPSVRRGRRIGATPLSDPPPNRPCWPLVRCSWPSGVRKDGLSRGVDRWPVRVQRIERARRGKAFQLAAVEYPGIDPFGEIIETLKSPFAHAPRSALPSPSLRHPSTRPVHSDLGVLD